MALIPQNFLSAAVPLGTTMGDQLRWIGTGFFVMQKQMNEKFRLFLVTAKHLIDGQKDISILVSNDKNELNVVSLQIVRDFEKRYSVHENEKIDLAAIALDGGYFAGMKYRITPFDLDKAAVTSSEYLDQGGCPGAGAFMIGYPTGISENESSAPIVRTGSIARMDRNELAGKGSFLVDVPSYPGNAGSPVVSRPEVVALQGTQPFQKCVLLGMVNSHISFTEVQMDKKTGEVKQVTNENSGLARAIPVECIRDVIELENRRSDGVAGSKLN